MTKVANKAMVSTYAKLVSKIKEIYKVNENIVLEDEGRLQSKGS